MTRSQLRDHGYDDDAVRWQLRARRWQAPTRRIVVLHNGPLTMRQYWWVAVMSQDGGALAGATAAREHGLTGFDDAHVHVVVAHGARPHSVAGARVHVSRRYGSVDIHPGRSIPTVRVDRAIADAATWSASARRACGFFAAAVQQRLTTASRLRAELEIAGAIRHAAILRNVLGDIEGGAQSFAEIDVCRLARKAGLPAPRRQSVRTDRQGRKRYIDVDFDAFLLEVDGGVHLLPMSYWDDMQRQNDLIIVTGKPVLRIPTVAIRLDEQTVIRQLADARRRFWP